MKNQDEKYQSSSSNSIFDGRLSGVVNFMLFLRSKVAIPPALISIPLILLAGCSLVPGSYMGVSPVASETDQEYVYDISGTDDIDERADIFSITPSSIAKQMQARELKKEGDARERGKLTSLPIEEYKYLVGAQDVLYVTVWNHPEINNPAGINAQLAGRVVNEDGTFFFPYAGKVKAAGRTVQQIRDELAVKLAEVLVEPQVDVAVLQYRSKRAFVLGQVEKPGAVVITDVPLTVTDLISQGGGVNEQADLRAATLTSGERTRSLDLYALYYQGDVTQNVRINPGDILTVPENRYNKVFVLGEVSKPQSLVMPRGRISLAEALADSGGFNPLTSNAGQMYVIREGQQGRPQIWHLDAKSPDALVLADRFDLQARDIVYVDPAGVARFSRVINNILPSASAVRATVQN